ncbi:hypothetical protein [Mycolicibacterium fortuitum]|uniref:hypothetical protein n=1 Tax=Mycolicibacterium fortuitum TaxID=1766 RepID=UPI001CDC4117|nr:hypothetical protein [Mycolicibacterium fortuitum]
MAKRLANHDQPASVESLVDVEDLRRRCAAHDRWMSRHPEAVTFAEARADENLEGLPRRR